MGATDSRQNRGLPGSPEPPPKRRKVRKGTRSCWECKRRKIRCIFDETGSATVCQECRQRGATCVSQEDPEQAPAQDGKAGEACDRLVRVERLVEQILDKLDASSPLRYRGQEAGEGPRSDPRTSQASAGIANSRDNAARPCGPRPPIRTAGTSSTQGFATASHPAAVVPLAVHKPSGIREKLAAALPSREDVYKIYQSGHSNVFFHQILFVPYSALESQFQQTVEESTDSLFRETHPAVLAKSMLVLATMLQRAGRDPTLAKSLSESSQVIMTRLAGAAISLVCANDELMGPIEALHCLLLQSVYLANGGNLRLSLLSCRRAMTMAQLMGLHRPQSGRTVESVEPPDTIDHRVTWFRILYIEHFVCLLLGLPSSCRDASTAMPFIADDHPLERLERLQISVASKIMDRNECDPNFQNMSITRSIDLDLQYAAATMPSRWWTVPDLASVSESPIDILWKSLRMTDQLFHHFLLIQLHLPFMLRAREEVSINNSKLACINASREVLTRYIMIRTYKSICGIPDTADFFALVAAMALLLGHIDTHRLNHADNALIHQRHTDRTMVEDILECMRDGCSASKDVLSIQGADVLRRLLKIEADAAGGLTYSTKPSPVSSATDDRERPIGDPSSFHLKIPYFGTVIISPDAPVSRETVDRFTNRAAWNHQKQTQGSTQAQAKIPPYSEPSGTDSSLVPDVEDTGNHDLTDYLVTPHDEGQISHPGYSARVEDWSLQGVDAAFFDSITRGLEGFQDVQGGFGVDE